MNIVIISIGSNIHPEANINEALKLLGASTDIIKTSSFIVTKPVGMINQPDFTNGAVKVSTSLSLESLTTLLKGIEAQLKRDRSQPKFGPRTIDLDIVAWNGTIVDEDYHSRDFLRKTVDELI